MDGKSIPKDEVEKIFKEVDNKLAGIPYECLVQDKKHNRMHDFEELALTSPIAMCGIKMMDMGIPAERVLLEISINTINENESLKKRLELALSYSTSYIKSKG